MAKAPESTGITGNVLLYKNPKPLTKEAHSKMGVSAKPQPFDFLRKSHFVPITAPEFGAAANSYPIIFAGANKNPLAVMGIRGEENLFVQEDGQFNPDYYMPAFARRYPFVLAGDEANNRFVVCVDEQADCVVKKNPERPFFEGDQLSAFTQEAFEFLQAFERDRRATEEMIKIFNEHDLFEQKEMNFQGNNADGSLAEKQKIAEYFAITEERLKKLDDATLRLFSDRGYLAVAYAHILSLSNWQRLVNITLRKISDEQKA
ncbi:SapC family protein [Robiginitomaculum antarcticum]|uniref:SapC family protein n=1 Tax=Robiginitomaculum antarcticum TaxID=437507 RepID=UPI000362628B|nr:SapC family protein [Robiginitomaculum antarcticum]